MRVAVKLGIVKKLIDCEISDKSTFIKEDF